jgi:hypothetical protein
MPGGRSPSCAIIGHTPQPDCNSRAMMPIIETGTDSYRIAQTRAKAGG